MIRRLFVEKKAPFQQAAEALRKDLETQLQMEGIRAVRHFLRYDVEGVSDAVWEDSQRTLFAEPPVDHLFLEELSIPDGSLVFAVEYLPGQYDQRADAAEQCLRLLGNDEPSVACAEIFAFQGDITLSDFQRIKDYLINPVDSREAGLEKPQTLKRAFREPEKVQRLEGFCKADQTALENWHTSLGLAMSSEDLAFCQRYFREEAQRDPSITEIKLLDTYWSDHCRHTTFLTEIKEVEFEESSLTKPIKAAWDKYLSARENVYGAQVDDRPVCLMDIALMGMKSLRAAGRIPDLEESE